jgi:hypothetical protein
MGCARKLFAHTPLCPVLDGVIEGVIEGVSDTAAFNRDAMKRVLSADFVDGSAIRARLDHPSPSACSMAAFRFTRASARSGNGPGK